MARFARDSVRSVHMLVLVVELGAIGWLVWTGATGRRDRSVAIAAGLVGTEAVVWLANDRLCPLSQLAERLGEGQGSVSDLLMPDAMARTLPIWSSALVALGVALHARSFLTRRSRS